jgi:hypothetical protein
MELRVEAVNAGSALSATAAALAELARGGPSDTLARGLEHLAAPLAAGLADGEAAIATQQQPAAASAPADPGLPALPAVTPNATNTAPNLDSLPGQPTAAADSAAAPWLATSPSAFGELAAAPLLPVWVQGLQAPPLAHLRRPDAAEEPQRRHRRWGHPDTDAGGEHETGPDERVEPDDPAADSSEEPATQARTAHPLHPQLPPLLQAELQRRRGVLVWAPQAPQGPGVQAWWLGFDDNGRALKKRLSARGEGPREAAWQWWLLKRSDDDGRGALPTTRPAAGSGASLALRVCAGTLPAPLRPPGQVWLDLGDAPRLWRDLGTQWTWLTAWSPRPLPWMR